MKRLSLSIFTSILTIFSVWAEAPAGYYKQCEGKSGKALLQELYSVIGDHTTISDKGLWSLYNTSDVKANGKIWDMYSTKEWTPGKEQCGNYSYVGDCYNREHSFPKSWFNDASPMVSDAFHIYPTDGKVNGQRSNYPYGECANGTTVASHNGIKALGKLGNSTFAGYSGKVFEPDDEYKGDFARSYFYMAACYNDRVSTWKSDMLASNNYPVFSSWAINLLLKWHRQDPVSDKETRRNDVVYSQQKNRNPFIDHPELAEHIWGNKQSEGWQSGATVADPIITSPVDGAAFNVGITGLGVERSLMIPVRGNDITSNITASVTGNGFSINTTSISADLVNSGRAGIIVSYLSNTTGTGRGTLTLTSGKARSTVTLTAEAVDGLTAAPATDITETSFIAHWANIDGDGATYSLMLYLNGSPVAGYPIDVPAEDEWILIDKLEPDSQYAYELSNGTLTSNRIDVHTAAPTPSIQFLFDGELEFTARTGEPSDIAELLLDIANVTGDIVVTVTEPFEVSTDKADWNRSVTIAEGEDRMYLRLYGNIAGTYTTSLRATAGSYTNDDVSVLGTILSDSRFVETFEAGFNNNYNKGTFEGTTGTWKTNDAGVWDQDTDKAYEGEGVCRYGKSSSSWIATAAAKNGGIGTVSFMAMPWGSDGNATIAVQYSTDGTNWTDAGNCTITGTSFSEYTVTVNKTGSLYIKLLQTAGKRLLIDNIKVSDYSAVGAVDELYYHSWDAFCRDHKLVIENKQDGEMFNVYGMDGIEYFGSELPVGETQVQLPKGLYIVVSADFSRRVLVK